MDGKLAKGIKSCSSINMFPFQLTFTREKLFFHSIYVREVIIIALSLYFDYSMLNFKETVSDDRHCSIKGASTRYRGAPLSFFPVMLLLRTVTIFTACLMQQTRHLDGNFKE